MGVTHHGRTYRLDLADPTLREWTCTVLHSSAEDGIVLDRSAFYPGGGGQPPDHGVLLWQGVAYSAVKGSLAVSPGEGGGLLLLEGLLATLPHAVDDVELEFAGLRLGARARAFDAAGKLMAEADVERAGTSARLSGEGIVSVEIETPRAAKTAALTRLCYSETPHSATVTHALSSVQTSAASQTGGRSYPLVQGRRSETDPWEDWTPHLASTERGSGGECVYLAYDPPDPGPWWGFRISPFPRWPLLVVSACGVTWSAAAVAEGDAGYRADLTDAINSKTDSSGDTQPAQHPILAPGSQYSIRVRCDWQGWRRSSPGETPPPPDDTSWQALPDQVFHFQTASEPATLPVTPANFADESSFDARATARYLLGFDPDGSGPPHFLDDTIEADFSVDHLPQLLSLYSRDLQLKIRRTDQAPGALAGGGHPADEPYSLTWKGLDKAKMHAADRRMTEAMDAAHCLTTAPLGGTTAEIDVDLAPNADYDLMLVASPTATPDSDEILVARTHFHTSRYRNAGEMLAALGLTTASAYPILPDDALIDASASVPVTAQAPADDALEGALVALSLDPWPLPTKPRLVLIWRPASGGGFELAGAMLEGDEPLLRPVALSNISAQVGSLSLAAVRSNAAGTRVLLAASPGPATVTDGDALIVTLTAGGSNWVGMRLQVGEPRLAYQETV